MNLLQYYDNRLVIKNCAYNYLYGSTRSIRYFKLFNNILNEGCPNDSVPSFDNYRYNEEFSTYSSNDVCLNNSIYNCNDNSCLFGTVYEKLRCYPVQNRLLRSDSENYIQNMMECNRIKLLIVIKTVIVNLI